MGTGSLPDGSGAGAGGVGGAGRAGGRRRVRYESLGEVLADLESLCAGPVVSLGAWTPAQNVEHVGRLIRMSRQGMAFTLPLPARVLGRVLKGWFLKRGLFAGLKTVAVMEPAAETDLGAALASFRAEVEAASRPGAMSQPSPLFGPMTHADWERMHCRHAELHFSFLVPGPGAGR